MYAVPQGHPRKEHCIDVDSRQQVSTWGGGWLTLHICEGVWQTHQCVIGPCCVECTHCNRGQAHVKVLCRSLISTSSSQQCVAVQKRPLTIRLVLHNINEGLRGLLAALDEHLHSRESLSNRRAAERSRLSTSHRSCGGAADSMPSSHRLLLWVSAGRARESGTLHVHDHKQSRSSVGRLHIPWCLSHSTQACQGSPLG